MINLCHRIPSKRGKVNITDMEVRLLAILKIRKRLIFIDYLRYLLRRHDSHNSNLNLQK
jgi:hypothetical protein